MWRVRLERPCQVATERRELENACPHPTVLGPIYLADAMNGRKKQLTDLEYTIELMLTHKKDPAFEARVRAESERITREVRE